MQVARDALPDPPTNVGGTEKDALHLEERSDLSGEQGATNAVIVKLSGTPSKKQFSLFTGFDKNEPLLESIILPFKLFMFPIVHSCKGCSISARSDPAVTLGNITVSNNQ